jgi:transcriptional regulator GlxA family with amidase domain
MSSTHRVVVVTFDGHQLLDLAGPIEVLSTVSFLGASPAYEIVTVSAGGSPVTSTSGIKISPDHDVLAYAASDRTVDTLLVVGGVGVDAAIGTPGVVEAVARLADRATRVASVCTGALMLAAAGLLDGRQATTHWAMSEELERRHPRTEVLPDRIHVRDGNVWTSAGVTAGMDLALAIVEDDHGARLAQQAAGWLVVFMRRPGGQQQFSAALKAQATNEPQLRELIAWIPDHLSDDLTVASMARRVGMSGRSFARTFRRETGVTPAAHVETIRVETAKTLLATTDTSVAAIARRVGFRHAETLHRAFRRSVGTTPDSYRKHFALSAT